MSVFTPQATALGSFAEIRSKTQTMGLLDYIFGTLILVTIVVAIPLVCHLCYRNFWIAVALGALFYSASCMVDAPGLGLALLGLVLLVGLPLALAPPRWKGTASWLVCPVLLAWSVVAARTTDDFWMMLVSVPALAPLPAMVGVFVAAFRNDWRTVRWGRIAAIALGLFSIWWWLELYPTMSESDAQWAWLPSGVDGVVLFAAGISFLLGQSRRDWGVYGGALPALLAVVLLGVGLAIEGSGIPPEGRCEAGLTQVMIGASEHADAHGGFLPDSLGTMAREYGLAFDRLLVCPAAESRGIPPSEDGYEYAGAGLRVSEIEHPDEVPVVFDRAGNHRNHTRSVGFVDESVSELTERQFRELLLRAVRASAYPKSTVEELKAKEPWLATEMTRTR